MTPALYSILIVWIVSHLLVVLAIPFRNIRNYVFLTISLLLAATYVIKPYTYDLAKYVVYIETGQVPGRYSWQFRDDGVLLDPRESLDNPFSATQGYESGFRLFSLLGNKIIPHGYGIPRIDPNGIVSWQMNRKADLSLLSLTIVGLIILLLASKRLLNHYLIDERYSRYSLTVAIAVILGSVFFCLFGYLWGFKFLRNEQISKKKFRLILLLPSIILLSIFQLDLSPSISILLYI